MSEAGEIASRRIARRKRTSRRGQSKIPQSRIENSENHAIENRKSIAVISDTHDRLPDHVCKAIAGADEIWHLGDVCRPTLLEALKPLTAKLRVVRGNCDECMAWPLTLDFELRGHRFHLEHILTRVPPKGCDFFLHGHTHVPRDEMIGGVRYLNPGCITRPNRGSPASYAWLGIEVGRPIEWRLVRV